jgi:hypothetical protein
VAEKLSLELVKHALLKEEEIKRVKVATIKLRNKKSKEIGKPKDPSTKLTKVSKWFKIQSLSLMLLRKRLGI